MMSISVNCDLVIKKIELPPEEGIINYGKIAQIKKQTKKLMSPL